MDVSRTGLPDRHTYTEAAVEAVTNAARTERDFGLWVAHVLCLVAAALGSIEALVARCPDSEQAAHILELVHSIAITDEELAAFSAGDQ